MTERLKRKMIKIFSSWLWILCFLDWNFSCPGTADECEPNSNRIVVNTSVGKIEGQLLFFRGIPVHQFLGVPYAKPPLGDKRFKKPEPVDLWTGTLQATTQPPACFQYNENPFPWYDHQPGKSEDCLYLNIWAPEGGSQDEKKAVLFWIFGGGFAVGSIRKPIYDGIAIASKGDVVVVTISYRLGPFGFLSSGTQEAPGNVGMYDILAGLQWVRENIESFGGDPSRITIAGVSAGSIATGLMSVSPLARGLYARQIMQCGSPAYLIAYNKTKTLNRSQQIAEKVGCANQTFTIQDNPQQVITCLRDVEAMDLSRADAGLNPHSSRSFLPQYGDELFPQDPRISIAMGNFQKNDILIGNNLDEGSFQITTGNPDLYGFFGEQNPSINKSLAQDLMRSMFSSFKYRDAVVSHYLPDSISDDDYELPRHQLYTASVDYSLLCPTVYFAESYASRGSDVYFYFFTKRPSTTPWAPWMGVAHFEEVQFVFGSPLKDPERYEEDERRLSAEIIEYWTQFIKNGRPTETWPKYSRENPTFTVLDVGQSKTGMGPHRDHCDFFRPYFGF